MANAIDCKFGSAAYGDTIVLNAPFRLPGAEVIGKLTKIEKTPTGPMHTYELYLFGVLIGIADAKQDGSETTWRMHP